MTILAVLAAVYALLVYGVLLLFVRPSILQLTFDIDFAAQSPMPPLYRSLRWLFTALLARAALSTMGFWWIDVDTVSRKRSYVPTLPPPM
jgi:ABC-type Mn2+/Zn2+ transport system permease subunit